jgi:hypothetical protein
MTHGMSLYLFVTSTRLSIAGTAIAMRVYYLRRLSLNHIRYPMSKVYIIHAPLKVILPRVRVKDKSFILNLNIYRNTNQFTLNDTKKKYKALMRKQIMALPEFATVEAVFINYSKTAAIPDTHNVCCIHEKYFADALVEFGKIPDDKPLYWKMSKYLFGGIDRKNPRVTIILREAKPFTVPNL